MKGDTDLDRIARGETMDAAFLQFDFIAETDSISFKYIFASEEYMEFVNMSYNDVFGFFLSGPEIIGKVNLAVVPGNNQIVSVDNINANKNAHLYVDNGSTTSSKIPVDASKVYDNSIQFDGFTKPLTAGYKVTPNKKYTIKIAIADVGDRVVDSAVFLQGGSFKSTGKPAESPIISRMPSSATVTKDGKVFRKPLPRSTLVEFDFDSAAIPDTSMDNLYFVSNAIKPYKQSKLEIRGHTDYIGTEQFNIGLSNRRVQSVVDFLIKEGFPRNRIVFKEGFGEYQPKATNETEEGRQKNRRVEVIILWE
jgi:outer membrane protein OmpA-like peptidoglycan-associated protein